MVGCCLSLLLVDALWGVLCLFVVLLSVLCCCVVVGAIVLAFIVGVRCLRVVWHYSSPRREVTNTGTSLQLWPWPCCGSCFRGNVLLVKKRQHLSVALLCVVCLVVVLLLLLLILLLLAVVVVVGGVGVYVCVDCVCTSCCMENNKLHHPLA